MKTSLRQRAYEHIRHKLLTGQLRPGTRLSNREMAREIGVSLIPVREAMSQLSSEGLLEHKPKVGTFVINPSRQELEDLCDLREALECHAVGKVAGRATEETLAELERHNARMQAVAGEIEHSEQVAWQAQHAERWTLADAAFHLALLRAAGNRRALKIVSDLRVMTYVFGHRDTQRRAGQIVRALGEHGAIIEALRRHDAPQAVEVTREHLRRGRQVVLDVYDRRRMHGQGDEASHVSFPRVLRERIHQMEEGAPEAEGP